MVDISRTSLSCDSVVHVNGTLLSCDTVWSASIAVLWHSVVSVKTLRWLYTTVLSHSMVSIKGMSLLCDSAVNRDCTSLSHDTVRSVSEVHRVNPLSHDTVSGEEGGR